MAWSAKTPKKEGRREGNLSGKALALASLSLPLFFRHHRGPDGSSSGDSALETPLESALSLCLALPVLGSPRFFPFSFPPSPPPSSGCNRVNFQLLVNPRPADDVGSQHCCATLCYRSVTHIYITHCTGSWLILQDLTNVEDKE